MTTRISPPTDPDQNLARAAQRGSAAGPFRPSCQPYALACRPLFRSGWHLASGVDWRRTGEMGIRIEHHDGMPGRDWNSRNQPEPSSTHPGRVRPGKPESNPEELPLSTRVHELAKELGLKSQDLLDRIQKWGLEVKANALASLDPAAVDRIRELMNQPASGKGAGSSGSAPRTAVAPPSSVPARPTTRESESESPPAPRVAGSAPATSGPAPARPADPLHRAPRLVRLCCRPMNRGLLAFND